MPDVRQSEDRMRRIESRQNASVKALRLSFHDAAPNGRGLVAVEGMHLLEEAIRAGLRLDTVFFSESALPRAHKLLPQLSAHTEVLLLPDEVFSSAVPTLPKAGPRRSESAASKTKFMSSRPPRRSIVSSKQ